MGYFSETHATVYCFYILTCSFSLSDLSVQSVFSKPHARTLSFAAQTPIEEFTPTPAFPALQYLESVDEGGVAWRAGLRMGDFLIEVNLNEERHSAIKHQFVSPCTFLGQCC